MTIGQVTSYTQTWKFGRIHVKLPRGDSSDRTDRTSHKRFTFIPWHSGRGALSLWNVGHNSLAVRCGGAKAEGPVFSLTLSSLMTNTWIFTGVSRSYLVMAVDTGHYWAHRQSRADTGVSVCKFWRGTTAMFQTTLEQLVYNTIPLCTPSTLAMSILLVVCAIFYWQSCIITRVLEWMQLINSFPYTDI